MNLTNPSRKDVMAAISGPMVEKQGILGRIAAPIIRIQKARELNAVITEDLLAIHRSQFEPMGHLKHLFIEPDNIPVENLQRFKDATGLPCPMIYFSSTTDLADGRQLRMAPELGMALNPERVLLLTKFHHLPEIVDPRYKRPAPEPDYVNGGVIIDDTPSPMIQQRADLLACGKITIGEGYRYYVIQPVTAIAYMGRDRVLKSIEFGADEQGRKTTLLFPIIEEMPGRPPAAPAFLVYGKLAGNTREREDQRFHNRGGKN